MKQGVVVDLGVAEFAAVWELQKQLVARRQAGEIDDTLLLVEHPHVVTVGRRIAAEANILRRDMPIFEIERGGDVTYHGPGQLVGYPIILLDGKERDLHAYLRHLEDALIAVCATLGLPAGRNPGWTGVWIAGRKVASIGIAVRKWVTMHGFALNVTTDLERFRSINPCGLEAAVMTSLAEALGQPVPMDAVKDATVAALGETLGRSFRPADRAEVYRAVAAIEAD
jgi:lipoate-protein ligase B